MGVFAIYVLMSPAIGITSAAVLVEWKVRLAALAGLEKFAWTQILPEFDPFKYVNRPGFSGDPVT